MWLGTHDDLPTGSPAIGPVLAILAIALGMFLVRKWPAVLVLVLATLAVLVPWLLQRSYWQYIGYLSGPDANIGPAAVYIEGHVVAAIAAVLIAMAVGAAWHLHRQPSGFVALAWGLLAAYALYQMLRYNIEPAVLDEYDWDQWCWYWLPPNHMVGLISIGFAAMALVMHLAIAWACCSSSRLSSRSSC